MTLLKTRPNLRLLLERHLVAGEVAAFTVEVNCPKPVPVDAVSLTLVGDVVWFSTSQYGRHRNSSRFLEHAVALLDETTRELPAGTHRLRTRMHLGANLPGSWEGDRLAIEYSVIVHVDIPWWPDARVEFGVQITAAGGLVEHDPGAIVYASRIGGPPAKGPYLEISLGRQRVEPGTTMQLSAALGNVDRNRYRKLDVAIVAQEALPTGLGGQYVCEHVFGRWSVGLDNHSGELQPIPFNLELPRTLAPGFELHGCKLQWLMQIEADVAWGVNPKLRFPITVLAGELAGQRELATPLAVGSDRLRLIWSAVAKATKLEYVDGSLHGRIGQTSIEVHRSQRDGEACVIGIVEFPYLGVGLHTQRARRGLLGNTFTSLATRDAEQTTVVLAALGGRITNASTELFAATDTGLRFALPGTGLELDALRELVELLIGLAPLIDSLPAALPAPAIVRTHVEAWRSAARTFNATLHLADLRLVFTRDGQTVTIATTYDDDGGARSTELTLDPGVTIHSRHHLLWTGDFALPSSELPIEELAAAPTWAAHGPMALQIDANRVRVVLPAPLVDPMLERARVDGLLALGRTLRGEQGPYR